MKTDQTYDYFNCVLLHAIDTYIPGQTITNPYNNALRQPWMTSALLKSSKTKDKMHRKRIGKQKYGISFKQYILYTNTFYEIKIICTHIYTEIGHTYALNIPPSNKPFQHNFQHTNCNSFFMMPNLWAWHEILNTLKIFDIINFCSNQDCN